MTIVEFLRARLEEDEQVAFDAIDGGTGSEWRANGARVEVAGGLPPDPSVFEETVVFDEGSPSEEQATHIARHDPARALREVEAKRAIVERCADTAHGSEWDLAQDVLRLLALPCADHPDYDTAWTVALDN